MREVRGVEEQERKEAEGVRMRGRKSDRNKERGWGGKRERWNKTENEEEGREREEECVRVFP